MISRAVFAALLLLAAVADLHAAEVKQWWQVATPTPPPAHAVGSYARGCLAGAVALPLTGAGYQVMRPSRGRRYGHPRLIGFIEALAAAMRAKGRSGLLIGDLAQPRGGPMPTGHRSHQLGLDVDIWFRPAPNRVLTDADRESLPAVSVVAENGARVDPRRWGAADIDLLRTAAGFPEVARIFVNPAIKRALCETAKKDRSWLAKIRPWWGHTYHFHVRLRCPPGEPACADQPPPPAGDGCGRDLGWWFSDEAAAALKESRRRPPARQLSLDDLPPACRRVLSTP